MLEEAIRQVELLELELIRAIDSEDENSVYEFDRQINRTFQRILMVRPDNPVDKMRQIDFLLGKIPREENDLSGSGMFESVRRLIEDYLGNPTTQTISPIPGEDFKLSFGRDFYQPLEQLAKPFGSIEDMFSSDLRVSIIDLAGFYQDTSEGNASFYQCSRDDLKGKHVADMIGSERYHRRAKMQFERSFNGTYIQYFHENDSETGNLNSPIISCEMFPYRPSGDDIKGAVVVMREVLSDLSADRLPVLCQLK